MEARGVGRHAREVLHPCGAAQLASARSCSTDASSLLSRSDLLHLNAYVECGCQVFDELTEVHTFVGDVVEYGFVSIALIFHVANLHLQSEAFGDLSALDHGVVLARLGLMVFLHVHRLRYAIDASYVVGRFEVGLFDLQMYKASGECHHADVVSGIGLHSHNVAFLQPEVIDIVVISFARVLELHLHQVGRLSVAGYISQPVVGVELLVLSPHSGAAESTVASRTCIIVHDNCF